MSKKDILPFSKAEFEYRGMTGNEEDLLADENEVKSGNVLNKILRNCMGQLDGKKPSLHDVQNMKAPDRLYALVKIRLESFGAEVEIAHQCKRCNETNYLNVNINELKMVENPLPEGEETKEVEFNGQLVTIGHMTGHDERRLSNSNGKDLITTGMMLRIKNVEDVHANGVKKWLKNLPVLLRGELRDHLRELDCGYDTVIGYNCSKCRADNSVRMEHTQGFLFPNF